MYKKEENKEEQITQLSCNSLEKIIHSRFMQLRFWWFLWPVQHVVINWWKVSLSFNVFFQYTESV